ncbi:hypothetical protein [Gemmata palustris]|nr:hypothetical protein [Gemmata palustris]
MTEAEWLACADLSPMFKTVWRTMSERKLRLFTCGCCRRIWSLLSDQLTRPALELAERYADGAASDSEWDRMYFALISHNDSGSGREFLQVNAAIAATCSYLRRDYHRVIATGLRYACHAVATLNRETGAREKRPDAPERMAREEARQAELLRDVIGNPFRAVTVDPSWLTSTVVALAEGAYRDRAFDRLPILADALQDAGCDNDDVLTHCRHPGEHVRGCWVVDLLTGRK